MKEAQLPHSIRLASADSEFQTEFRNQSKYFIAAVILLSISALAGWQFEIEFLKRPLPGLAAMNPVAAVCFFLAGGSLYCFAQEKKSRLIRKAGYLLALLLLLVGILRLSELLFDFQFQIDAILYSNKLQTDAAQNLMYRMAPNTAFNFVLASVALILIHYKNEVGNVIANYLAVLVALIGIFSIIGYVYEVREFYGVLKYIPMSIHSGICFTLIALAMLYANPNTGFMAAVSSSYSGGTLSRILVPVTIIIPVLFGYIRLYISWKYAVTTELGVALLVTSIIIVFLIMVGYIATLLNNKDALREQAEEQIAVSNKRFMTVFNLSPVATSITSIEDGTFMYVNDAFCETTGFKKEELIGRRSTDLKIIDNAERQKIIQRFQESGGNGRNIELKIRKSTGDFTDVLYSTERIEINNQVCWVSALVDITKRKQTEEQIQKVSKEIQDLYDNAPCGYLSVDSSIFLSNINQTLINWLGYTRSEVVGKMKYEDLLSAESRKEFLTGFERDFENFKNNGYVSDLEFYFQRKDGTTFPVIVNSAAVFSDAGEFIRSRSTVSDNTDRKRTHDKIKHLNQELEAFTYSVSHDLRAPLRSIMGYTEILREDYGSKLDDEGDRLMKVIIGNAKRMGQLIDDLLDFSRLNRTELTHVQVSMDELVQDIIEELVPQGSKGQLDIRKLQLKPSRADNTLIRQVWINLISNALKYSRNKERIEVEIGSFEKDNQTCYYVRDNGAGFDMQYVDKLFGVFQRLHKMDEFEGTGVGLALVKTIVKRHGGYVWAEGKVNGGATFYFTLPHEEIFISVN